MSQTTEPGSKSAAEIEREVEGTRARLTGTIEELKERVAPGNLVDQAMEYVRSSGGQEFVRNLGTTVRDNPVPLLLIGAGIGWLMMSGRRDPYETERRLLPAPRRTADDSLYGGYGRPSDGTPDYGGPSYGSSYQQAGRSVRSYGARAGDTVSSVRDGVADAASSVRESVAGVAQQAGEALASARDGVASAARSAGEAVSEAWESVRGGARQAADGASTRAQYMADRGYDRTQGLGQSVHGLMQSQPLVAGGIGLLVGAALGSVLPGSEAEDRLMGETRDQVAARVQALAEQGYEQAKQVANEKLTEVQHAAEETYGRVKDSIAGSGLTPERGADALGKVAREVRETVEQTARDIAGQARDATGGSGTDKPTA
jgi:hypothetical protein